MPHTEAESAWEQCSSSALGRGAKFNTKVPGPENIAHLPSLFRVVEWRTSGPLLEKKNLPTTPRGKPAWTSSFTDGYVDVGSLFYETHAIFGRETEKLEHVIEAAGSFPLSTVVRPPRSATPPETAVAMIAKDGERVPFHAIFSVSGAVEAWLSRLVAWMQTTLVLILKEAVHEAALWEEDKPREEWLFGYPAELALLASQVRSRGFEGICLGRQRKTRGAW